MAVEDDFTLINLFTNMTDGCISSGLAVTPAALNSQTSSGISLLSDLSSAEDWMETNGLCPQQYGTKPPIVETACMFVQSHDNDKVSDSKVDWQSDVPRKALCKSVRNLCVWEDPISDQEEEEDESLYMMNLFSRCSDLNDPFIFQAPLEIQMPGKASPRVPSQSECSKKRERLDYALPEASDPTTSTSTRYSSTAQNGAPCKKVQFSDHVEEFTLSSENHGHASWQEVGWPSCQEAQGSGSCLQPKRSTLVKSHIDAIPSIKDCTGSSSEEENQADDEASDSDTKEEDAESLSLLNSSRSSDPYNPFSFQEPDKAPPCVPSTSACRTKEERLDNAPPKASAPAHSTLISSFRVKSGAPSKKVKFSDDVEAFYLSGEEDRRGPWQEAAVDRFRFQRRCQEVEKMISYCFEPKHRSRVYGNLYANGTCPTHCVGFTGENTSQNKM